MKPHFSQNTVFSGKTRPILIKVGGKAAARADAFTPLWKALAALHHEQVQHGGGVVLVHGGGDAVDAHLQELGKSPHRHHGIRVTPDDQIDAVVGVLRGAVNLALVGAIRRAGAHAVGLSLGDGDMCQAHIVSANGIDLGRVGEVTPKNSALIWTLLSSGFLPIVASIALDDTGAALNVNADDAAAAMATLIGASHLVLLSDVEGVCDETGAVLDQLHAHEADSLIERGIIKGGMIPKVRSAFRAAERTDVTVRITSWNSEAALTELMHHTSDPCGTIIRPGAKTVAPGAHSLL